MKNHPPDVLRFLAEAPILGVMIGDYEDSERLLGQFNKLIGELLRGSISRNTFRPWEVEILLDIEHCNLKDASKKETLRRYQKAVQRQMEKGVPYPMKLSEYLNGLKAKREATAASNTAYAAEI